MKTTSQKIKTINSEIKQLDSWQDKFKYAVIQRNRLLYEKLCGMEVSSIEVITCAEIEYFNNPKKLSLYKKAMSSQEIYGSKS